MHNLWYGVLMMLFAALAASAVDAAAEAYIKRDRQKWTIGTASVERVVSVEDGKLLLKSFKNKATGRELIPNGVGSEEFSLSIGDAENRISGASGGWELLDSKETRLKDGERQLDITLQRDGLQVIKSYVVYPKSSIIREWLTFKNAGAGSLTVIDPTFLDISTSCGDLSSLDFNWMSGGENHPGSWKLKTESFSADKPLKFDSYEPFPFDPDAKNGSHADAAYGFRAGTGSYAPWYSIYGKDTKNGLFIGWDYFGHWKSSFEIDRGAVRAKLVVAGFKKTLAPDESFITPKAFVGLYKDDLDNAGNECLDWQYNYLWDYTRDGWFPAIRMLGFWWNGTGWGQPGVGWHGGNPDWDSTFRKVFRVADLMRYCGADVYHRDWGWWDKAGDWNGPDWRTTIDYLHKYGMGQLIYAFLYTVANDSQVAKAHPEWVIGDCLDMSKPEVVEFMNGQLDSFVRHWGNFEWRNDSGFLAPRDGDDTVLLSQDQGLRQVIQGFLDKHPMCAFQAVNGGGNYGGYDYTRFASSFSFSDGAVGILRNYYASLLLPPDKTSDIPDAWQPDKYDKSIWRGLLCINFDMTGDTADPAKLDGIRELIDIYHYLQKNGVVGRWVKVYRPTITGDDPTMYLQRLSGDRKRGIIIPKHQAPAAITIRPKGLLPEHVYLVSFQESEATEKRTGADLMAKGVVIETMAPGELIYLNLPMHPGSKLDTVPPTAPTDAVKKLGENMGYPGVELAWKQGTDDNWISYYEVLRDGISIDKVSKGEFYFDHSAGAHLAADYEIRTVDGAGNVSSKTAAAGPPAKPATVYDDSPSGGITFTGDWQRKTGQIYAYNGTLTLSNQKGATAELTFEGKRVLWFTKLGAECGKAEISIDGGVPVVVDTYSADDIWGVCIYRQTLPTAGKHTLRITVTGEKTAKAGNAFVHIDGIRAEQ